jgi:hypothetical protein
MIAIIAESDSDIETLCVFLSKMRGGHRPKCVAKRGVRGAGNILREGEKIAKMCKNLGAKSLLVCRDADNEDPVKLASEIFRIISPAFGGDTIIIIPVQMIEAWLIADPDAVSKALDRMRIPDVANPESLRDPKNLLVKHSRDNNSKPRYVPDIHNAKIAGHVDINVIKRKCKSFATLSKFATKC